MSTGGKYAIGLDEDHNVILALTTEDTALAAVLTAEAAEGLARALLETAAESRRERPPAGASN